MFYNYAQFKKATKILLEEMKATDFKLSELRLRMVQLMGFSSVQGYEAHFNREAPKTITVLTIGSQFNIVKKDFTANDEGVKKAIDYFVSLIREVEPDMDESEVECFIDDGFYAKAGIEYQFHIVHNND